MRTPWIPYFLLTGIAFVLQLGAAAAQPTAGPPAHVAVLEGSATLTHDGLTEPATIGVPLLPGDRLSADTGRVEIQIPAATIVHLDRGTIVQLGEEAGLRLLAGRVIVTIVDPGRGLAGDRVHVDTPAGTAWLLEPGRYRLTLAPGPTLEAVVREGYAELSDGLEAAGVGPGETAWVQRGAPVSRATSAFATDGFDRWSDDRLADAAVATVDYLPPPLRTYGSVLTRHGSWAPHDAHGYVWYPQVASGWRPYHQGRWALIRRLGVTWIGHEPWAWPTHHYGRWGLAAGGRWFWIPGQAWAAAWVSWGTAPGFVGWCALGFDNAPVVPLLARQPSTYWNPWHAWSVIPRNAYGRHVNVAHHAISGPSLGLAVRSRFTTHAFAPASDFVATARVTRRSRPVAAGLAAPRPVSRPTRAVGPTQSNGPVRVSGPSRRLDSSRSRLPGSGAGLAPDVGRRSRAGTAVRRAGPGSTAIHGPGGSPPGLAISRRSARTPADVQRGVGRRVVGAPVPDRRAAPRVGPTPSVGRPQRAPARSDVTAPRRIGPAAVPRPTDTPATSRAAPRRSPAGRITPAPAAAQGVAVQRPVSRSGGGAPANRGAARRAPRR